MEVLYRRCCGLDVHKETVVACLRLVSGGKVDTEVRTFETTTASLIALSEWLAENGCTHIAMEATGIYWKPVWHILADGEFQLILANSAHVKNVPGRKTDVNDATWLAELLAHGLIRASFVPDTQTQELRTLLRTRKQLVREKASHILRVQKTLEDANIKLESVITDVMGMSGRAMIEALIAGESDPAKLARLANYRLKTSQEKLREALRGRVTKHHRFLLRLHLNQIDALDAAIATIDQQVEAGIAPFRAAVEQVSSVPGIRDIAGHHLRDWHRYEPVPIRRPSHLLGRSLSAKRRERRQASIQSSAEGCPLAQDHTRAMRLGGRAQEGRLPACPILAAQGTTGSKEGDHGRCRLHPYRHLPHAQGWNAVSGPRLQSLPEPIKRSTNPTPGQTLGRPRL
jgi:transposase